MVRSAVEHGPDALRVRRSSSTGWARECCCGTPSDQTRGRCSPAESRPDPTQRRAAPITMQSMDARHSLSFPRPGRRRGPAGGEPRPRDQPLQQHAALSDPSATPTMSQAMHSESVEKIIPGALGPALPQAPRDARMRTFDGSVQAMGAPAASRRDTSAASPALAAAYSGRPLVRCEAPAPMSGVVACAPVRLLGVLAGMLEQKDRCSAVSHCHPPAPHRFPGRACQLP